MLYFDLYLYSAYAAVSLRLYLFVNQILTTDELTVGIYNNPPCEFHTAWVVHAYTNLLFYTVVHYFNTNTFLTYLILK